MFAGLALSAQMASAIPEPVAAAHAIPVASYTMRARLDPQTHTVHGEGSLVWTNTSAASTETLYFHLYLNAFKSSRSIWMREPVGAFRGGASVAHWGGIDVHKLSWSDGGVVHPLWPHAELHPEDSEDETDARVPLPRPVLPGETITLEMEWDARLPPVIERTGYADSFHFVGQWFPKIARLEHDGTWAHFPFHRLSEFYADYGTYDVTIDVPAAFAVGATGSVVESRNEQGRHIERRVQPDVHDFAWTAWDHFQSISGRVGEVSITLLYPPGYSYAARRELEAMRFALPHFERHYGRYPYPVLTVVHPPKSATEAGGMEYPTLITTGGPWFGPPGLFALELVTIHEFGHQYFYGLLGSNEQTWPFLDEGLNSFAEQHALSEWLGTGSIFRFGDLALGDADWQATHSNRYVHHTRVAQPAQDFATGADYGALVYARTSATLETIRRAWGSDGLTAALRRYALRHRFGHPVPKDLVEEIRTGVGEDAAAFLHGALFERGWLDYRLAGIECRPGKEKSEFEGWVFVNREGTLTAPVEIELHLADGSKPRIAWDGKGEFYRVPYRGSSALVGAVIDPEHRVLLDQTVSNNHGVERNEDVRPSRTWERLVYWFEILVQAVFP